MAQTLKGLNTMFNVHKSVSQHVGLKINITKFGSLQSVVVENFALEIVDEYNIYRGHTVQLGRLIF